MFPTRMFEFEFGMQGPIHLSNISREAFMCADPKSTKKDRQLDVFFALLGSLHVKAVRNMLVKLTPAFNETFPALLLLASNQ